MRGFNWLPWRRPPPPIDEVLWRAALAACPLAQLLPEGQRAWLRTLCARFLDKKRFHPIGMQLDDRQRLLIAMLACLPILRRGFRALHGWQGVVVYPGEFKVRHAHHDAATGVVSEREQVLSGEAWHLGPLVLAWSAIEEDLADPWGGGNVVIHEIAHKLDMLDGPPDGVPPLPRGIRRRDWINAFQQAYDRLHADLRARRETLLDPYAATDAGEFFAVVSEMHFSDPRTLARAEPRVAALLADYYGPSPAA